MLNGVRYGPNGSLLDDTGHSWRRVCDWVEPVEAERLVKSGVCSLVRRCLAPPHQGRVERFKRDVSTAMLTRRTAEACQDQPAVRNVMVGELWRSDRDCDLLLFVQQGPFPRGDGELQDDW